MSEIPSITGKNISESTSVTIEGFMNAACELGCLFLECGGPVTRLETQLARAGEIRGIETSVNATPSNINIYCYDPIDGRNYTKGHRIQDFDVDLSRLKFVDRILAQFANGELRPGFVRIKLRRIKKERKISLQLYGFSIFGIGAGAALLSGATLRQSLLAASFTLLLQFVVVGAQKYFGFQKIFRDFIACFFAFLFSVPLAQLLNVPSHLLSLGTLVYVVPGLLLTSAISEIVDQNFLSGTIRMLKAFYLFMSMALAYFLSYDLLRAIKFTAPDLHFSPQSHFKMLYQLAGSLLIIVSAAIEFKAHRRTLRNILFCGFCGALVYFAISGRDYLLLSTFCSAFTIGAISFWLGRKHDHPSQIYSVPSILVLAPGMLAFSSFGYGRPQSLASEITSNFTVGAVIHALLISMAIVFGLAAGRLPFPKKIRD